MIDALLPVVLLVAVATLAVAVGTLRSSRRAEDLGEDRYELLRDQHNRLDVLREERLMLIEELKRESQERRQLMESLEGADLHLAEELTQERRGRTEITSKFEQAEQERLRLENELRRLEEELKQERQGHLEVRRRAEQLEGEHKEHSGVEQEMARLRQERQQLAEELEKGREGHAEIQRRAEQRDQERIRLERELQRLRAELESREQAPAPERANRPEEPPLWRRRPVLVVGLLFGGLAAWFVSLLVALSLLAS